MNTTRMVTLAGALGLAALIASPAIGAEPSTELGHTINFTNQLDTLAPIDVPPTGPSAGDAFYLYSHAVSGDVSGKTAAGCVVASVLAPGVKQCEVDFLLATGTITARGLTDSANLKVQLVITGGTGEYAGASGAGTLTPTETGSKVTLHLKR